MTPPSAGGVAGVLLEWAERESYGRTELFARAGTLEHSVGPAGFTIRDGGYFHPGKHELTWWHGNRGYGLGIFDAIEAAKEAARNHLIGIVRSFAAIESAAPAGDGVTIGEFMGPLAAKFGDSPAPAGGGGEELVAKLRRTLHDLGEHRQTHVVWRDWLLKDPANEQVNPHAGSAKFHDDTIKDYDRHLAAIEEAINRLASTQAAGGGGELPEAEELARDLEALVCVATSGTPRLILSRASALIRRLASAGSAPAPSGALLQIAQAIVRDSMPATKSGQTCFVPRYQIDALAAALAPVGGEPC